MPILALILAIILSFSASSLTSAEESEEPVTPSLLATLVGLQPALEKYGIGFEAVLTTDWVSNISGGLRRRTSVLNDISLTATFDPEKVGWWQHGFLSVTAIGDYGTNPTAFVGDLQGTSNIEAADAFRVLEAWYEHQFFQDTLALKLGLYDYNSEFYVLDYAGYFLNSSFGIGVEAAQTGPSIFPMTSLAVRLKYQPTPHLYAMTTVYDGIPGDPGDPRRTAIMLRDKDGIFYGLEVGWTSDADTPEERHFKVAVGGWYHDTSFDDFNGQRREHNQGIYLLGEVALWREQDPSQGLGMFTQLGFADGDRNQTGIYVGAGLTYTGLIPRRDHDVAGIALAYARSSDAFLRSQPAGTPRAESAIEFTYRAEVLPWLAVQPDLQYVIHPGTDPALDDAVVFTLRLEVTL